MASADLSASPVPEAEGGSSGEFVLKKLFAEFVVVSERKLQQVCSQSLEYPLAKGLARGEDAEFDQILSALNEVSSFCLRSVLTAIFKWRDMQMEQSWTSTAWGNVSSSDVTDSPYPSSKKEKGYMMERRELAVDFLFCLVLVEVMPRLSVHPVPESFIHNIEDLAFKHFKQQESIKDHRTFSNPNVTNMRKIADLYAEVIGVLSQSRFHSVRRRFFSEIRNPAHSSTTVISIIEGMSFIRVKMFPVEELEQWFAFLQECAQFFLDCSREKIKAAMSSLLVEVLLPVAAVINLEASLPVAKKLVAMLYGHCTEHAKRARHSNTYIPLATVLLAISEQSFFLNGWHYFLTQNLLPSLKRGDTKIHTIALVSLYRLVWVYMVRIHGESNKTTMVRLRTILDVLFPRGQRGVLPKEMPLNYFVKLIQFIAKERLEYAMQEVILELLSQGRSKTAINPERMIIGLRAFLMITDSLEKNEGDPPMPINTGPLPSRGVSRVKNRFLSNTLSNETAKKIGIIQFYPGVRRALDGILRSLDHHVGRQLTSTNPQAGKSVEEILSAVKPKLDLLKTCVIAIPRILPESMTHEDLTDLLSRLTIHLDHELGRAAANSLHTMVTNYPAWRHDIVRVFVQFLLRDVPDSCPLVLEATLKLLIQSIRDWRQMISSPPDKTTKSSSDGGKEGGSGEVGEGYCVPWVEACGLVTLCSYRSVTRRLSLVLLREVRSLHEALAGETHRVEETPVMDVIESVTPVIIKRYLSTLSLNQRNELRVANQSLTLNWLADRAACFLEQGGSRQAMRDPWALCLAGLMEPNLLPQACHMATHLAWPYLYQRMMKAFMVLDPGGLVADKGDKPSSMRGRQRPVISSVETFLWRNYFIFASCSAPPSSSQESSQEVSTGRPSLTARDLFSRVVPLIRWEGEIREVAVTALGLVHPPAFGDLVEQLQPVIHDALEQRKDVKRRRRREALKIQITRVFELAAEHGCFQHSHMARTEHGQISPALLEFIEGIKSYLDSEKEGVHRYPELQLHFAGLIANIISSVPQGQSRVLLFSAVTRQTLFYLFANWCGLFGQRVDMDVRSRNPQVSFSSLQAMSALLCCGPVFQSNGLDTGSPLYRWMDNMLTCSETRVQTLGRKTVQLLLYNNANCHTLFQWVVDRCYDSKPIAAQLCFHALSSTIEAFHDYPCDMVTILHVVLFKTADPDHTTRERAMQLLQLLDRRFLSENGHSRPELLGCLTGGAYSQSHITFSGELATSHPELTFPIFSEMVYRFEMAPHSGQRNILQCMVPWLANVELMEENPHSPYLSHSSLSGHTPWPRPSSAVLQGSGWGSLEGTKLVLHNLLYITAKFGEEFGPEVEGLWSSMCSWPSNLRVTINYLARLTCSCGNMAAMVQQAKRIMVSFSRRHASAIVAELIRDLQSVEIISADLQLSESPPFYCLTGSAQAHSGGGESGESEAGEGWTVRWRAAVRGKESSAVPLPTPASKQYYASLQPLLKLPAKQLAPLHRCNFALMVLSELVLELRSEVDWFVHLPLLLHVALLGLDLMRPLVCEHSRAMLGNLVIVLACKDDMLAAVQARLVQQEVSLRSASPSPSLAVEVGEDVRMQSTVSAESLGSSTSLLDDAQQIINLISQREGHRARWPFADISSRLAPSGEVPELSVLVNKIIQVFSHSGRSDLKEKWARKALHWATSCSSHQYASQSFQVCRALQLPLSPAMFREILTRLAESASDTSEDMQSYVLEIVLTLECALDHLPETTPTCSTVPELNTNSEKTTIRKISDLSPLPSEGVAETPLSPPPPPDSSTRGRHHRVRSITSKQEMVPQRPASAHARIQSPLPVPVVMTHQSSPLSSVDSHTLSQPPSPPKTVDDGPVESVDGWRDSGAHEAERESEVVEEEEHAFELRSDELKGRVRMKITPLSVNRSNLHPNSLSTSPQKIAVAAEHMHAFSDTAALSSSEDYLRDGQQESRARKGSEPPPSLMSLFERDSTHRQQSCEEEPVHLKQHSFDNSRLSAPPTQASPRHRRRMKSPVLSDRETEKAMKRTPSHPHLHQTRSTPHFTVLSPQPLTKAHSTQQLRASSPNYSYHDNSRHSYSGSREDMRPHPLCVEDSAASRESFHPSSTGSAVHPSSAGSAVHSSSAGSTVHPNSTGSAVHPSSAGSTVHPNSTGSAVQPSSAGSSIVLVKGKTKVERAVVKEEQALSRPQLSLEAVPMRSPARSYTDMWRRNSTQIGLRREAVTEERRPSMRPRSMVETSTLRPPYSLEFSPSPSALVAQMFWTAVCLLESDFEAEFSMALRLIAKCLEKLDLSQPEPRERLEKLLPKFKWPNFPGVQAMLMKGLTLDSVADATRNLLVYITPFSTQPVFDPSQFSGLPLNIVSLMPVLVHHFSNPTHFCLKAVANIRKACEEAAVSSTECKVKLQHISRMFQMYSCGEFPTGCDIWLAGICRYLNEAYTPLTVQLLRLLTTMLEQGPAVHHRAVLRLLYEYLRLQEPLAHGMHALVNSTMVVVHRHLHGPLWREAVDLLKLAVSSSAALVQPPTRGLPVDLGLFNQTLPGPTLQFSMDLQPNSRDLGLVQESLVQSSWKNPAGSQRSTRERLLSVINACIPVPVLMSSPSVVFTDEQALIDKATMQSSASDEAGSSLASMTGDLSSQPEAQSLIAVEFNFLDDMEYIYDSSSESEILPGPFSRPGEEGEVGEEEEEEEEEESFSESEVAHLELSMSDLEPLPSSSLSDSSLLAPSYDSQSLSSQLLVLGQTRETLTEEEEPEDPLPYGAVHHHESSHASTLSGGSPDSRDVSLENNRRRPLEVVVGSPTGSAVDGAEVEDEKVMFEPPSVEDEQEYESALSDSGTSRDSTHVDTDTISSVDTQYVLVTNTEEDGSVVQRRRECSEPPTPTKELSVVIVPSRGGSEPPTHTTESPAVEGEQLRKPPWDEGSEPTAEERQLSEPPPAQRRQCSEPPQVEGRYSEPPTVEERHSEPPTVEERHSEPPTVEGRHSEPPTVEERHSEPPTVEERHSEPPTVEGRHSEPPTVEGRHSEPPTVEGRHSEPPTVEGRHSEPPTVERRYSEPPTAQRRQYSEPPPAECLGDMSDPGKGEDVTPELALATESEDEREVENGAAVSDGAAVMSDGGDTAPNADNDRVCEDKEWPASEEQVSGEEIEANERNQEASLQSETQIGSETGSVTEDVYQTSTSETSRFIALSNEEIGDMWRKHVANLGCDKSGAHAVHTHFLFVRLFPVLRHQFTVLTREACNYLGHEYNAIASHFLVTVELMGSQLHLPSVYVDSELLLQTRLVDSHVFLTLEMDGNLEGYYERRKTVLQRLEHIKLQLRQQSRGESSQQLVEEHVEILSLSPGQAALKLCQAVHRLHFQLLVLLGSYVKLLHSLESHLTTSGGVEVSQELTEMKRCVEESVQSLGRVSSPLLDQAPRVELTAVADMLRALEDALTQKQWSWSVQLLRALRTQSSGVEMFGCSEDDDVDCLFFIYARFLSDKQEGVLCITSEKDELSGVHSHLMAQNVSLHALLEVTHQTLSHTTHT